MGSIKYILSVKTDGNDCGNNCCQKIRNHRHADFKICTPASDDERSYYGKLQPQLTEK